VGHFGMYMHCEILVQDTPAMGIILCKVVKPKFTFWLIQVVPPILVVCVTCTCRSLRSLLW